MLSISSYYASAFSLNITSFLANVTLKAKIWLLSLPEKKITGYLVVYRFEENNFVYSLITSKQTYRYLRLLMTEEKRTQTT